MTHETLLSPIALTPTLKLRNRVVMAPMTTWAANDDLTVSEAELDWYRARVQSVGMVITGCTHVMANGIGFTNEFAAYDDSFLEGLKALATAAKSGGAPALLQVFHAGNKALPHLIPTGTSVAPSALPVEASGFAPAQTPRALTEIEILEIIAAFGATTRRAIAAGFDGIELHGAHGFLIQNFLSPATNQRQDQWGGSSENRRRFALAVVAETRRVAESEGVRDFILGVRLSPEETGGYGVSDTLGTVDALISAGVDYLHLSLADAVAQSAHDAPDAGPIAKRIADHVAGRVPVIAAGGLRTPTQAEAALKLGLSGVAIGQGLVMNPDWVAHAQAKQDAQITQHLDPAEVSRLAIPEKLWVIIDQAKGWFSVKDAQSAE